MINNINNKSIMSTALKNKKIKVLPISRNGGWLKPGHDGNFMYTGTSQKFCVALRQDNGKLVDPLQGLTDDEKLDLAKKMAIGVDEFNVNSKSNFWIGKEVKLDKENRVFDLNDANDFIEYSILKTNKDTIAPSFDERLNKGTYKFALVDMDDEVIAKRKSSDEKKEAYKQLGKMEASDTKLRNFFKVYGKRVPADATKDWMVGQIDTIIETDIKGFLTIVEDVNYELKLEIQDALDCRALIKKGTEYELPGGESLGNLEEILSKFKNPKFSEVVMTVRARIEAAKK